MSVKFSDVKIVRRSQACVKWHRWVFEISDCAYFCSAVMSKTVQKTSKVFLLFARIRPSDC